MAFLRTLGPLVAVAVASLAAVPPQAARANSVVQVRPVVALASPVKDGDAFMATVAHGDLDLRDLKKSPGSVLVRWVFGVAEPAAVTSSDRTLGPVMRYIVVADVDPNFERWQKDADEKLKDETARKIV